MVCIYINTSCTAYWLHFTTHTRVTTCSQSDLQICPSDGPVDVLIALMCPGKYTKYVLCSILIWGMNIFSCGAYLQAVLSVNGHTSQSIYYKILQNLFCHYSNSLLIVHIWIFIASIELRIFPYKRSAILCKLIAMVLFTMILYRVASQTYTRDQECSWIMVKEEIKQRFGLGYTPCTVYV